MHDGRAIRATRVLERVCATVQNLLVWLSNRR